MKTKPMSADKDYERREQEMKQTILDQAELLRDYEKVFEDARARSHKRMAELQAEVEKLQLELMERDTRPDYERGERAGEDAMMHHIATLEEKNNSALARAIRNCTPFAVRANILSQVATWLETASYKTGEAFDSEAAKACKHELDTIQARAEKYQGPQPDDL